MIDPPLYVEVTPLLSKRLTGLGRFTARLVEALAQRRPLRLLTMIDAAGLRRMNLHTVLHCGDEIAVDAPLPAADGDVDGWTRELLRRPRRRHDAVSAQPFAGIYSMFRPTVKRFAREISILYDFTPLLLPWSHEEGTRRQFGAFFSTALPLSDKAIAISRATKHDAGWLTGLAPDDVVTAYPGPSLCSRAHACRTGPPRSPHLILVVSTREPRKNANFVLDWFVNSQRVHPESELWWVGPEGWLWDETLERSADPGRRRSRFRFLGAVSDARLCELYRSASLTIYPSLYEGFGFPVLDSLCHGTPVLTSFNSALKEFAGPGVFYFDPCEQRSLDDAYDAWRGAPPFTIDDDGLRATYSWDHLARTLDALLA